MYANIEKAKKHIEWLDFIKSIAICCVILVHVTRGIYDFSLSNIMSAAWDMKILMFVLSTFGRIGVPLFIFASGYLLLDRPYTRETSLKFWKRNLLGLLLTTEIWIIIYNFFLAWYTGNGMNGFTLIKNMLFLKATDLNHTWYMPMILGIYLFIPFVGIAVQHFDIKMLRFPMMIVFVYLFVVPVANVILNAYHHGSLENQFSLEFGGGIYGFYLVLGFLCKRGVFKAFKTNIVLVIGILAFFATVALQIFANYHGMEYEVWNECALLLISALCFFEGASRIKKLHIPKLWRSLADCSFGIYLVHNPLRKVLIDVITLESTVIKIALIFVITLVISWGIVYFLGKIPYLRRILFFLR